jgi:hypothetical protein
VDQEILLRRQLRLRLIRGFGFAALFVFLPLTLQDQFARMEAVAAEGSASTERASSTLAQADSDLVSPAVAQTEHFVPAVLPLIVAHTPVPAEVSPVLILPEDRYATGTETNEAVEKLGTRALAEIELGIGSTQLAALHTPSRPFALPKWLIAASAVYQYSNLYNETTRMGHVSTSHIRNESKPNFSVNVGLLRLLTPRSSLSMEFKLNDVKGQTYQDFEGADYLTKSLVCTYQTIGVNYHRTLNGLRNTSRLNLEASAGVYGSYRSNITETVGAEDRQFLSPGMRKYDLGLQCALQGVFKFSEPVHLTFGTYYTNGLINIFKGVEKVPANFYTSFTASYGLTLGLRYQLNN